MMSGFIHCHISNNVPTDYNGEDLSFLLDSKGPGQVQYMDAYAETHKEHMNVSKGKTKSQLIFTSSAAELLQLGFKHCRLKGQS